MPRIALLAPACLVLTLTAGASQAQYGPDYPPAYQDDPYNPRYAAPYAYERPAPYYYRDYPRRPYPDTARWRYDQWGRPYPQKPFSSYFDERPQYRGPTYTQPRYPTYSQQPSYPQPQPPAYSGPQSPAFAQPPSPTYGQPRAPSYSQPPPAPAQNAPASQSASVAPTETGGRLLTPAQEGSRSVVTAAEAPLHDLNLVRQTIPDVLLTAMADPYAPPASSTCGELALEIANLSQALGPDYDAGLPEGKPGIAESGGLGLSLMHSAAASVLPLHGYVSTLSGAAKHDEKIMKALNGGVARRAYLKGLGEARGCQSPASPIHYDHPPIRLSDDSRKPYYPIR